MADYNALLEIFKKSREKTSNLIETGTNEGAGILMAVYAGYNKIYSCDILEKFVTNARNKFDSNIVEIFHGSSEDALRYFLSKINECCTIFLDGHVMPNDTQDPLKGFHADQKKETEKLKIKNCPLMEELEIISSSNIKNHIIIIDDIHCFDTWMYDWLSLSTVINKIKSINQNYNCVIYDQSFPPFLYCYVD